MEDKKFVCQFATMTMTGEKPDVEIHAAGKREEDGMAATVSLHGGGRDIALLVSSIVKDVGKSLRKKDSIIAAAAFVDMVTDALMKGCGKDAVTMAAMMATDKVKKAIEALEDEEEDEEEGAETDAEPV